jgi:cellulose synthase/poly-beta-1,6-N-acetylglucosamine synthase-like glycosyltransferase
MDWNQRTTALALVLLAYTWIGYPALLLLLQRLFARPVARAPIHPQITLILAAHNEQQGIGEKLRDCLNLKYPPGRVEILVVSDHCTDATEEIVEQFASQYQNSGGLPFSIQGKEVEPGLWIRLIRTGTRAGKSGAQNLGAEQAKGEILFFTDTNTRIDPAALEQLVENFGDPRVGLVTATVHFQQPKGAVPEGQGMYWRYELLIRRAESDLGILAKASGQAIAVRRELFRPMQPCFGDDCILPLEVRVQGYRVVHEHRAIVTDTMPHTLEGEMKARIRMTARNWTGTLSQIAILNPLRFPVTSWALVSHKVLRWLSPLFLVFLFATSTASALRHEWIGLWMLQVLFYASAFLGWQCVRRGKGAGVFGYAFAFCLANLGFFFGLVKALRNQRIVAY